MSSTGPRIFLLVIASWTSLAAAQTPPNKPAPGADVPFTSACTREAGIIVCRSVDVGTTLTTVATPNGPKVVLSKSDKPGRLLFLLDIPSNIFARLAAQPERNREFHPKAPQGYQPAPPAPPGAGDYAPAARTETPIWRYQPKTSFEYQPKQNWTYNRDVFGRLWRQNIVHDTKVVELPVDQPGVYLLPVAGVR